MTRPEPITDYYGIDVTVDLVFKSAGPFIYLETSGRELMAAEIREGWLDDFFRFTPDQARELAKRLNEAADEVDR